MTPIAYIASLAVTVLSPALHVVLALLDLTNPRRMRFTRLVGLGIAFCVVEFVGLTLAFLLWVASGFGHFQQHPTFQKLNFAVFRIWLLLITKAIETFVGYRFVPPRQSLAPGPNLVLARHAGPGDALMIARWLTVDERRRLRMLGTTKLLWDPFFNHLVQRLPFHFCDQNPANADQELEEIKAASATIEQDGAMIVFPEGGNYTPRRYDQALARFAERGQEERLERTRNLHHVLPPRTGGTAAAIRAAEGASITFVAHVGLDDLLSLSDLWRAVPVDREVRTIQWHQPQDTVPPDHLDMVRWIFDQWQAIDDWIDANLPEVIDGRHDQ